jgi:hypothetical protein
VCGSGDVDVLNAKHIAIGGMRVVTSNGARTGLLVADLKRLFVAAPARHGVVASIWELDTGRLASTSSAQSAGAP